MGTLVHDPWRIASPTALVKPSTRFSPGKAVNLSTVVLGGTRHSSTCQGTERGAACRPSPGRLSPAGRWTCVSPVLQCPAHVSGAGCVLPPRPSPWTWRSHARRPRREKTPHGHPAGVPGHHTPPPARPVFPVAAEVPAACCGRVSPPVPQEPSTILQRFPRPGAGGASHVLRRLSSGMPPPVDSSGPSHPRPRGCAGVACGGRSHPRPPPPAYGVAVPALQGARSPRRPPGVSVDASSIVVAVVSATTPPWTQDSRRVGGEP
jgi:hypothetical protein